MEMKGIRLIISLSVFSMIESKLEFLYICTSIILVLENTSISVIFCLFASKILLI